MGATESSLERELDMRQLQHRESYAPRTQSISHVIHSHHHSPLEKSRGDSYSSMEAGLLPRQPPDAQTSPKVPSPMGSPSSESQQPPILSKAVEEARKHSFNSLSSTTTSVQNGTSSTSRAAQAPLSPTSSSARPQIPVEIQRQGTGLAATPAASTGGEVLQDISPSTGTAQSSPPSSPGHKKSIIVTSGPPLKARESGASSIEEEMGDHDLAKDDFKRLSNQDVADIILSVKVAYNQAVEAKMTFYPNLTRHDFFQQIFVDALQVPVSVAESVWLHKRFSHADLSLSLSPPTSPTSSPPVEQSGKVSPSSSHTLKPRRASREHVANVPDTKMIAMLGTEYADTVKDQVPNAAQINPKIIDFFGTAGLLTEKLQRMFGADITPEQLLQAQQAYAQDLTRERARREATSDSHGSGVESEKGLKALLREKTERGSILKIGASLIASLAGQEEGQKGEQSGGLPGGVLHDGNEGEILNKHRSYARKRSAYLRRNSDEAVHSSFSLANESEKNPIAETIRKDFADVDKITEKLNSMFRTSVTAEQLRAAQEATLVEQLAVERVKAHHRHSVLMAKPTEEQLRVPTKVDAKHAKAVDLLGDDALRTMMQKSVPSKAQVTQKVTNILGEVLLEKPQKIMGEDMTPEQRAALKKATELEQEKEKDQLEQMLRSKTATELQQQVTSRPSPKALTILGDSVLEEKSRTLLPMNAQLNVKALKIIGQELIGTTRESGPLTNERSARSSAGDGSGGESPTKRKNRRMSLGDVRTIPSPTKPVSSSPPKMLV